VTKVCSFGKYKTLMAVLHRKEEKIEVVLSKLPKDYTDKQFVELFIQLYSKDWGKIKANYLKQSQDKEPGTVITMPKPELYLKSILTTYLENTK
jgi:chloramphenicol O-acetyltransferase